MKLGHQIEIAVVEGGYMVKNRVPRRKDTEANDSIRAGGYTYVHAVADDQALLRLILRMVHEHTGCGDFDPVINEDGSFTVQVPKT